MKKINEKAKKIWQKIVDNFNSDQAERIPMTPERELRLLEIHKQNLDIFIHAGPEYVQNYDDMLQKWIQVCNQIDEVKKVMQMRKEKIRYYYELQSAKRELDRWPDYRLHKDFKEFYAYIKQEIKRLKKEFESDPITNQEFINLGTDLVMELMVDAEHPLTKKELLSVDGGLLLINHKTKGTFKGYVDGVYTAGSTDELHLSDPDMWLDCVEYGIVWNAYKMENDYEKRL